MLISVAVGCGHSFLRPCVNISFHPRGLWCQDGNMGLVKQAVSALTKRKIMQLTHTYITLPLRGEHQRRALNGCCVVGIFETRMGALAFGKKAKAVFAALDLFFNTKTLFYFAEQAKKVETASFCFLTILQLFLYT